jgi:uncharacterized protein DUF5658
VRLRSGWFGNLVVVVFLLLQACDGVFTYVGVRIYGTPIEGNPLIGWMMDAMGQGLALAAAKGVAGAFGIALHLTAVHRLVAALALLYFAVAIVPWLAILFW